MYPNEYNDPFYSILYKGLNVKTLYAEKWTWTIVFSLFYFETAYLSILYLFRNENLLRVLIFLYLGLIALSGLFYLVGMIESSTEYGYRISRYFMGFLQSPLPLLILIPAHFLEKK